MNMGIASTFLGISSNFSNKVFIIPLSMSLSIKVGISLEISPTSVMICKKIFSIKGLWIEDSTTDFRRESIVESAILRAREGTIWFLIEIFRKKGESINLSMYSTKSAMSWSAKGSQWQFLEKTKDVSDTFEVKVRKSVKSL